MEPASPEERREEEPRVPQTGRSSHGIETGQGEPPKREGSEHLEQEKLEQKQKYIKITLLRRKWYNSKEIPYTTY